jgi:uncharacterized protein (TIGR02117 family)
MKLTIVLKRLGYTLAFGTLTVAVVAAIGIFTPRRWNNPSATDNCEFKVYVSGGAMHVNLIVPVQTPAFDWRNQLDLQGMTPQAYLQFGWGDRIFYAETPSWQEVSLTSALRALFGWQNASALFVKVYATVPKIPDEELKCLRLDRADYLKLMQFLQTSFATDARGGKITIKRSQDNQSSFYAATGYYSILKTCNSWTAEALDTANVNTPLWTGLAPAVMLHLKNGCTCDQ